VSVINWKYTIRKSFFVVSNRKYKCYFSKDVWMPPYHISKWMSRMYLLLCFLFLHSNPCCKSLCTKCSFVFRSYKSYLWELKILREKQIFVLSPSICSEFLADLRLVYCDQTFEGGENGVCTEFCWRLFFVLIEI
jgi:hypothetical protein